MGAVRLGGVLVLLHARGVANEEGAGAHGGLVDGRPTAYQCTEQRVSCASAQ